MNLNLGGQIALTIDHHMCEADGAPRSTLCQMADGRFLMPVLFTIHLCQ